MLPVYSVTYVAGIFCYLCCRFVPFLNFSPASGETRVRAQAVETAFNSLLAVSLVKKALVDSRKIDSPPYARAALQHLRRVDPVLARIIGQVGPFRAAHRPER